MGATWSAILPLAIAASGVLALVRTPELRRSAPGPAPVQRLGIVLVASPLLVLLLIGATATPGLLDGAQAAPLSPDKIADKTVVHLALYLALPLLGVFAILGPHGFLEAARRHLVRGDDRREALAAALGWTTLFSGALIASVALVWGLGRAQGGELLSAGGAEVVFSQTTPGLALLLAGVAAVAEELLFRGVLLDQLRRRTGTVVAVGGQALLFGFIHAGYGSGVHVAAAVAFGLAMGALAIHRGLLPAIGTHFLVNVAILGLWAGHVSLIALAGALLVALGLAAWRLSSEPGPREVDLVPVG